MADHEDLAGFVVVTFDSEGEATVVYDCGPVKPALLPSTVAEAVGRKVYEAESQEDAI